MKKYVCLIMFLSITIGSFAGENWVYGSFEFSTAFEHATTNGIKSTSRMSSLGGSLSAYSFFGRSNVGMFIHYAILFPQSGIDSSGEYVDLSALDYCYASSSLFGIAFKGKDKKFQTYGGLGFHYYVLYSGDQSLLTYDYYSYRQYNIGIGGEIGTKINITDNFYFSLGSSLSYDFLMIPNLEFNGQSVLMLHDSYGAWMIDPFIGIGFSWARYKE